MMKPSVPRLVQYYAEGNGPDEPHSGPFAAIITKVDEAANTVDLAVFMPGNNSTHAKTSVPFSEQPKKQHWCWTPKV